MNMFIIMAKFTLIQDGGYDNFFHRSARATKLWSHDHIYNIVRVT